MQAKASKRRELRFFFLRFFFMEDGIFMRFL